MWIARSLVAARTRFTSQVPANVARPFELHPHDVAELRQQRALMWSKVLPFVLFIWALTGAFYPAVDLCAGEKERGTMETLLISPARREEIVWGKFLTIWVFSGATALLNLASMGATTWQFSGHLPQEVIHPAAMFWCVLLVLPSQCFRVLGLVVVARLETGPPAG